jgi:hypothetical protein
MEIKHLDHHRSFFTAFGISSTAALTGHGFDQPVLGHRSELR